MIPFDDLPRATRSLLLAKLNLEIVSANCANIFDLARKRNQPLSVIWRDVCRKAGGIHCLMPSGLIESQYAANASVWYGIEAEATPSRGSIEQAHPVAALARVPEQSRTMGADMHAAATAAPAKSASAARVQRAQNWPVALTVGLGVTLVAGIGLYMVVAPSGPANTTRPTEVVRVDRGKPDQPTPGGGKQAVDPNNLPAPQGTVRRMNTISEFSRRNRMVRYRDRNSPVGPETRIRHVRFSVVSRG